MFDLIPYHDVFNNRLLTRRSFDVAESDNAYTITIEVPGIAAENLSVHAVQDELHVSGKDKYRSIDRVFLLPKGTLVDAIDATAADGVLTVVIPKLTARKIEIKVKVK